jgi:hypothetical protein
LVPHKSRGKARIRIKERDASVAKAKLVAKRKWAARPLSRATEGLKSHKRDEI